jgi:hypothetical protein
MLAFSDEQQSTTAWDIGALGEESLGKGPDRLPQTRSGCCMTGGSREQGEPLPQLIGVQDVSAAGKAGQERHRC